VITIKTQNISIISGLQAKLARTGLGLSMRDLADHLGVSHQTILNYEKGNEHRVSVNFACRLKEYYDCRRVFFGPDSSHSVSFKYDVFFSEQWFSAALFQLLKERGEIPSSKMLIDAYERSKKSQIHKTDTTKNGGNENVG